MKVNTISGFKNCQFLLVFSLGLFAASCSKASISTFPDVNSLLCKPKPNPPILTAEDAICFAAYIENVQVFLSAAQKTARYSGWKVIMRNEPIDSAWKVQIRSIGKILPSYSCVLSFNELGGPINSETPIVQCGYNK
jgi:hypothetical protein